MRRDLADTTAFDLVAAIEHVVDSGASDLHLKAGNRPLIRINGQLGPLGEDAEPLKPRDTESALHSLLPTHRVAEFERSNELDFAYSAPGLGRFRVNAYRQRGTIALVLRTVSGDVHTIEELGLPDVVRSLAESERGIILVTGTTGSGKSTTVAAMLEHINATICKHVVTVEDPIEYLFDDKLGSIDQREVGADTESFSTALRQVLRQDPDVIFVGEMRDAETVGTALSAAETGHLVLSTLHTADAPETINRIMDFFEPEEQLKVRAMLAGNLTAIVSQRLVPALQAGGRVAVTEVLTMTGRVHDVILNGDHSGELDQIIAEGDYYGMHSFDQALYEATTKGLISMAVALQHASHPHDLKLLVAAEGHLRTSMADVPAPEPQPAPAPATELEPVASMPHVASSVPPPAHF
jgi:twitching motility protein PilT